MEKNVIRAILACDEDWGIGKDGDLPWPHNPADLKWFKETTLNGTVVMGRSTWDSLPFKPLPKRTNIVITSKELEDEGCKILSFEQALRDLPKLDMVDDVWIIGGSQLVDGMLDIIDELYLSQIRGTYECDTFLPSSRIEEMFSLTSSGFDNKVYVDIWSKA